MKKRSEGSAEVVRLYFPREMHNEILAEAKRLERSVSWVVRAAWQLSRDSLRAFPAHVESAGHRGAA